MNATDLLIDGFDRVRQTVHTAVDGLDTDMLEARLEWETNSIAWLIWHLTRVQDDHIATIAETEQIWTRKGWFDKFGLVVDKHATGYGFSRDEVAAIKGVTAGDLLGYFDEVATNTEVFLHRLTERDLDRVVDQRWDPPVTLGVRLISVLSDDLQHVGQAAYIRGVLEHR
jgi:uncharacterized damage-inducible protein DinB